MPSADESQTLLTVDDWAMLTSLEVPEREGAPTVGVDLGGGRAFSAAVGIWPNGRCEAMAVAPGIPSIEDQERRDRTPKGSYQTLLDVGALEVAEGLRVQPPAAVGGSHHAEVGDPPGNRLRPLPAGRPAGFSQGYQVGTSRYSVVGFVERH